MPLVFVIVILSAVIFICLLIIIYIVIQICKINRHLIRFCQMDFSEKIPFPGRGPLAQLIRQLNQLISNVELHSRELENSLKKRVDLLDNIIYTVGTLVIVLDAKGRIYKFNKKCEAVTGLLAEEVEGKFIWDFVTIEHKGTHIYEISEILLNCILFTAYDNNCEIMNRDDFVILWNNTNIKDENNKNVWVIGSGLDITSRIKAEKEIKQLYEELEQKVKDRTAQLEETNQELQNTLKTLKKTQDELIQSEKLASLGKLVAGIAHEINTPMGISVTAASHLKKNVLALSRLFHDQHLKKSDLNNFIDILLESTTIVLNNLERASELVQSFKEVAVDQTTEIKRTFKLKAYLKEVLLSLQPKLKKSDYLISVNGDDQLEIRSYPGAFSQILTNFIMNSLIHGFENKKQGCIDIDLAQENDQIILQYKDDGKGISKKNQKKIFDPFFTTKRTAGGTGLGLHVVYNLVYQKIGGTIELESAKDRGTSFKIFIPISKVRPDPLRNKK